MDLQTIELPEDEARERFTEYRNAVRARHNEEDAAIMRGYRALAKGSSLISLAGAIRAGGCDEKNLPRLAVGKATALKVWLSQRDADGAVRFVTRRYYEGRAANNHIDVRAFPPGTLPTVDAVGMTWEARRRAGLSQTEELFTPMPSVPPRFRPARGLHLYDVLFEVDEWRKDAPPVTRDPALLRRLAGDLYVVCATWDLTELERLVLAGRSA